MEFQELQLIVESNSKAIQAMLNGQVELREELRRSNQELRNAIERSNQELRDSIELSNQELRDIIEEQATNAAAERQELRQAVIGIANLLSSLDSDRPTSTPDHRPPTQPTQPFNSTGNFNHYLNRYFTERSICHADPLFLI